MSLPQSGDTSNCPSSALGGDPLEIDSILAGAFPEQHWFSSSSSTDIFDVRGEKGVMLSNLDDERTLAILKVGQEPPALRIIFISQDKSDGDRLQITSQLMENICTLCNISSRFIGLIERQQMPARVVQYDSVSKKPSHSQFWYSTVIRSKRDPTQNTAIKSKKILHWMRFCVWAGRDMRTGTATIVALRCPEDVKAELVSTFHNRGGITTKHPMLIHTFFAQKVVRKAGAFLTNFAESLYDLELSASGIYAAKDFTIRSRRLLALTRQLTHTLTDYEILAATLRHLKTEHEWIHAQLEAKVFDSTPSALNGAHQELQADIWESFLSECHLLKVYGGLYEKRAQIGINECFAMVNQCDSEVNLRMAAESTQIARVSHKDGQSLRVIQILTTIFLPASLCSGIFGMGFFNTSPDETGNVVFSVSNNWWWYLALTGTLTALIALGIGSLQAWGGWGFGRQKVVQVDIEDQSCYSRSI